MTLVMSCEVLKLCTFHDGCKQGIDQQIFNRKSISRKITHPQSWKLQAKLTGEKLKGWSISREKFWVCFFSAVTSAFQLFTCKLCLQFSGLRMRNFTWNRFPIKNLLIDSLLTPIVESTYLFQNKFPYPWKVQLGFMNSSEKNYHHK